MPFLSTRVSGHTLLAGPGNCFSLDGIAIVNMKMGKFDQIVGNLTDHQIEVRLLAPYVAIVIDPRVPVGALCDYCTICCPFKLLPREQQRAYLKRWTPHFVDGRVTSYSGTGSWSDAGSNSDEQIDEWLKILTPEDA